MFGSIGITELILIAGVALMVLGPDKFPEFAKLAMRSMRDVRKYVADAQHEIAKELDPVKKKLDEASKINPEAYLEKIIGDDDDDDDGIINPEPELSDEELFRATEDMSEDWEAAIDMSDSHQEHVGVVPESGVEVESEPSNDDAVEYNPFGEESEGADPYGIRDRSIGEFDTSKSNDEEQTTQDTPEQDNTDRLDG